LLAVLRAYRARSGGRPMIVYFDGGEMPASIPDLSTPGVQVRFSASGQPADDAMVAFLLSRAQPGQYAVVTNDQGLSRRARDAGASVIRASDFAAKVEQHREAVPMPQPGELAFDPHDPAFADIFEGFIRAEKSQKRFPNQVQPEEATTWVERLYGEDLNQAQRAARWLGQYGGQEVLALLRDALTHNDVRVRAAALLALGDLGDRAALPDLCDRLAHDAGTMARVAAAQSLGRIGDRSAENALEAAAKADPKSKVRKAARAALEQIRARRKDEG
jgi:hypothetical protein